MSDPNFEDIDNAARDAEIEADFSPVPIGEVALDALMRGRRRRDIAADLGLTLVELKAALTEPVQLRVGEAPTPREAMVVLHAGLDDIVSRAYMGLDEVGPGDRAALLSVLVSVHALRARLIHSTVNNSRKDNASS